MNPAHTELTRDERILLAAGLLLERDGAAGVSVDAVAVLAELPAEVVRTAFPDILGLIVAALENRHAGWVQGLIEAGTQASNPRDEILTVFSHIEACAANPSWRGCAFINGYGELGRREPLIANLARMHLNSVEQHLRSLTDEAGLPALLADALSLLVEGAQVEAAIHGTSKPARSARTAAAMLISVYTPRPNIPAFAA